MPVLSLSPDGHELAGLLPPGRLLDLTGAPGAGKSTLASALVRTAGGVVVPMDGFHLSDAELARRGLLDRKGAPETFDAEAYAALLARIRRRDGAVLAPSYDRRTERPLANAIAVPPEASPVVTEGNYLLLDEPRWRDVRAQLDAVWMVVTDREVRRERLVARHVEFGKPLAEAGAWVDRVDEANARQVEATAARADLVVDLTQWSGPPATAPAHDAPAQ